MFIYAVMFFMMIWACGFIEVFMFANSFWYGCIRSGEWGDHVTLQAAADWV